MHICETRVRILDLLRLGWLPLVSWRRVPGGILSSSLCTQGVHNFGSFLASCSSLCMVLCSQECFLVSWEECDRRGKTPKLALPRLAWPEVLWMHVDVKMSPIIYKGTTKSVDHPRDMPGQCGSGCSALTVWLLKHRITWPASLGSHKFCDRPDAKCILQIYSLPSIQQACYVLFGKHELNLFMNS